MRINSHRGVGAVMLQQTWLTERMFRGMEKTLRGFLRQYELGIVVGHAAEDDSAAGVAIVFRPSLLKLVDDSTRTGTIDESIDRQLQGRLLLADFTLPDMTEITLCCDYAYTSSHQVGACRVCGTIGRRHKDEKNVPVLASKKEHTRLSESAPATATRLTMPRHKCPPNRVQAHTLRLFSP